MLQTSWGRLFTIGLAFIALGLAAILLPKFSSLAFGIVFAATLLLWGVLGAALSLNMRPAPEWKYSFAAFAVLLVVAAVFLEFPQFGIKTLSLLAMLGFLSEGVFSILYGVRLQANGARGILLLFSGLATLAIGAVALWGWPDISNWFLGLLLAVIFLTKGLSLMLISLVAWATRR